MQRGCNNIGMKKCVSGRKDGEGINLFIASSRELSSTIAELDAYKCSNFFLCRRNEPQKFENSFGRNKQ